MSKSVKKIILILSTIMLITSMTIYAQEDNYVSIHGLVSQGMILTSDNNYLTESEDLRYDFHEAALNFMSDITDDVHAGLQLFSRDLGPVGNNDIRLDWAYLEYAKYEAIGFRAGKTRIPFGLYNQIRDIDFLRTSVLLPQGIYNEYWRDFLSGSYGFNLFGDFDLGVIGNLSYETTLGVNEMENVDDNPWIQESFGAITGMLSMTSQGSSLLGSGAASVSMDLEYLNSFQINWTLPDIGLKLAVNSLIGKGQVKIDWYDKVSQFSLDVKLKDTFIYSFELALDKLTLSAEYFTMTFEADLGFAGMGTLPMESEAYYGMISYRINDLVAVGTYYSKYYGNSNDKDGDLYVARGMEDYRAWQEDLAIFSSININESWIVKIEYHDMSGTGALYDSLNPDGMKENWNMFTVKTTINF